MIRSFYAYYKPYKKLFFLDFFCAVLLALLELVFPVAVNQVIDRLLPGKDWSIIMLASAGLLLFYVINTITHYIVTYWGHMLGIKIETDIRQELFEHIQRQSFHFFDNNKTGHMISRLTTDLFDIGETAHHGPEDIFIALMSLFGAFFLMVTINWKLACITFVLVPILGTFIIVFNMKMTRATDQIYQDIASFNANVENAVGGIRVVQAFSNENYERKKQFRENNKLYQKAKLFSYKIMATSVTTNYFFMRLITLFTLISGSWFVIHGELSSGQFVAFLLLANIFVQPIEKFNAIIELYPKGIAGFKRFMNLKSQAPEIVDKEDAIDVDSVKGRIDYCDVSFGYEGKKQVLKHINLHIHAGETVAFVGPTGAGKTTLCSLLPRFYDVTGGRITIDGIDIQDFKLSSLRRHIGLVQQDVFLFSGTLRENVAYGKLDATDEDIWHVLRLAQLEDTVATMPNSLDTVIGERGVKLSGGQKQRLSIARMFLKDPSILILDEATSALDTETEVAIQKSLELLSKGRTTLIIAHRLATIKNADRIVVVTQDGISEQGAHDQLLDQDGVYRRLYESQFSLTM
ncbi:ABC transporter ATP-binding protein/permease [Sporolactobacillus shoreicorticis]|uniref:ABC transporter ATP-binding protein n=1 Tax=Sporolactobacillus shoreicorticis TaxID=1923877 RepID=A0ABW5S664_9BACL|nr:ABC transporter ATP-binding protein [Sporolactobacillus shoreicorticis]MCO7125717.1 ABC transporter ATP-binding protein/permease [Sporolactobacillus shoreicorticis]